MKLKEAKQQLLEGHEALELQYTFGSWGKADKERVAVHDYVEDMTVRADVLKEIKVRLGDGAMWEWFTKVGDDYKSDDKEATSEAQKALMNRDDEFKAEHAEVKKKFSAEMTKVLEHFDTIFKSRTLELVHDLAEVEEKRQARAIAKANKILGR